LLRFAMILALVMGTTWVVLSGYYTPMLLTLGAISIAIVLWMCSRMKILDRETAPYLSLIPALSYFFWLFTEIVKANVAVVKAVLSPELEVSPTMTKIPYANDVDIAQTMFANSITLTPGTVSINMDEDHILVHALLSDMSKPEDFKAMGHRSAWAVGEAVKDN